MSATERPRISSLQIGMGWFKEQSGGLNRYFLELLRHLPDAGVTAKGLVAGSESVAIESNGSVQAFAPMKAGIVHRSLAVRRAVRVAIARDPEAFPVGHFALYTFPALDLIGRRPWVFHFHGPMALESQVEGAGWMEFRVKRALERAVYKRSSAMIVLSQAFGAILQQVYRIPLERIHTIPGGVDTARFAVPFSRAEARAKLGWPTDRPIVLAVRRLAKRMGLEALVDAAALLRKRHPDVLVLIGGRGALQSHLSSRIESQGLTQHVRLLGYVPDGELPLYYRAADATIVPSVALEGFGLIAAESLAAGTPVLVTPVGGLPEVVRDLSTSLLLEGSDPQHLAAGVSGLLSGTLPCPDDAACRAFARAHYDWALIAERVRGVYESVLR